MGSAILAVAYVLAGLVSVVPAILTVFLFDAPGSTSSPSTVALSIAAGLLPLFFLVGGILRWAFHRPIFFLLPALDIAAIVIIMVAIGRYCGGMLAC
jgi:hypothetical protein